MVSQSTLSPTVPSKLPRVNVYFPPEVKTDLEKLAVIERRSMSQMVLVLVEDAIRRAKAEGKI